MRIRIAGSITAIRELEDCIRLTKKYTKGAFSKPVKHPVQGAEFPSRVLTEYYEVYPDVDVSWDMRGSDAWAWVWGDVAHIDVWFHYDYRANVAWMIVGGGDTAIDGLVRGIPGFSAVLDRVRTTDAAKTVPENIPGEDRVHSQTSSAPVVR